MKKKYIGKCLKKAIRAKCYGMSYYNIRRLLGCSKRRLKAFSKKM